MGALPFLAEQASAIQGGWAIVVGAIIMLIALGVPLYVIIGAVVFLCYAVAPEYVDPFGAGFTQNFDRTSEIVELIETPDFAAIPFFMIAGAIMGRGLIAKRLIDIAAAWLGWLPGGLGIAAIFACVFFAAISGSSPVTVVTIGSIMVPALKNAGYTDTMSYGLVTAAGGLGIIIPPSIPMVVYSIYASNSGVAVKVEDLFLAGFIPGLFIALSLSLFAGFRGRKAARQPFDLGRAFKAMSDGTWALFLPVFILGGIYTGLFNATQSAAMSVLLAVVIEVFIHRSMRLREIPKLIADNALLLGALLLIIMLATGFSSFVEDREIPTALGEWLRSIDLSPFMFILILNGMLLLVGAVLDIISAIVLFVPLIVPLAKELGFDPLHVGLIFIVNLEIGYLTPPIGLNLFVATSYFKQPFGKIVKAVAPFLVVMIASLAVITYVPTLSVGLPNLAAGRDFIAPFPTREMLAERRKAEAEGAGEDDDTMQDLMDDPEVQELLKRGGMQPSGDLEGATPTPGGDGDKGAAPTLPSLGPATDEFDADPEELDDEEEDEEAPAAPDASAAPGAPDAGAGSATPDASSAPAMQDAGAPAVPSAPDAQP